MQCPLCQENVSDENQLQVHYLMSCSGYIEKPNTQNSVSTSSNVQFRWIKSKPTLAREIFLLSSLADSIKLQWSDTEQCFLSEKTEVLKGLHACQLVVDGDSMSTEDFEVGDQTSIVEVKISKASLAGGSNGQISSADGRESIPGHPGSSVEQVGSHSGGTRKIETERRKTSSGQTPKQTSTSHLLQLDHSLSDHTTKHAANAYSYDPTLVRRHSSPSRGSGYTSPQNTDHALVSEHRLTGHRLSGRSSQHTTDYRSLSGLELNGDKLSGGTSRQTTGHKSLSGLEFSVHRLPGKTSQQTNDSRSLNGLELSGHKLSGRSVPQTTDQMSMGNHTSGSRLSGIRSPQTTEKSLSDKSSLYKELIRHQIRHGDSLDELLDTNETDNTGTLGRRLLNNDLGTTNGLEPFLQPANDQQFGGGGGGGNSSDSSDEDVNHGGVSDDSGGVGDDHGGVGDDHGGVGDDHGGDGDDHSGVGDNYGGVGSDQGSGGGDNYDGVGSDHGGDGKGDGGRGRNIDGDLGGDGNDEVNEQPTSEERVSSYSLIGHSEASNSLSSIEDLEVRPHVPGAGGENNQEDGGVEVSGAHTARTDDGEVAANRNSRNGTSGIRSHDDKVNGAPKSRSDGTRLDRNQVDIDTTRGGSNHQGVPGPGGTSVLDSHLHEIPDDNRETPSNPEDIPGNYDNEGIPHGDGGISEANHAEEIPTRNEQTSRGYDGSMGKHDGGFTHDEVPPGGDRKEVVYTRQHENVLPVHQRFISRDQTELHNTNVEGRDKGARFTKFGDQERLRDGDGTISETRSTGVEDAGFSTTSMQRGTSRDRVAVGGNEADDDNNSRLALDGLSFSGGSFDKPLVGDFSVGVDKGVGGKSSGISVGGGNGNARPGEFGGGGVNSGVSNRSVGSGGGLNDRSIGDVSGGDVGSYGNVSAVPSAPPRGESTVRQNIADRDFSVHGTGGSNLRDRYSLPDPLQIGTLTRQSPSGSTFGQEIRFPPSYTSSPGHLPRDSVISPTAFRRDVGEGMVTSKETAPSSSNDVTSSRSDQYQTGLARDTAPASVSTVGSSSVISGSSRPPVIEAWSEERIKELLDSLKEPRKIRTPPTMDRPSPSREKVDSNEMTTLRTDLAQRDGYIRKLRTKLASYKEEITKVRAKEMDLAKALSLAETNKATAKEQEDVVNQLTLALNEKELECSDLQRKVADLKQTQRLRQSELETTKQIHDLRVKELNRTNNSLQQEVRTLRPSSSQSSDYKSKYKKLLENYSESHAVGESLRDQIKLLEKENKELKKKVENMGDQRDLRESPRSAWDTRASLYPDLDSITRPGTVDGETSRLLARYQTDSKPKIKEQVKRSSRNFDSSWRSRNGETNSPPGYKSSAASTTSAAETYNGSSALNRFALDPYLPTREYSTSSRRQRTSVDNTSDVSDIDVNRYLQTRSYSSDSIVGTSALPDGFSESRRSPDKPRESHNVVTDSRKKEKKRRERPHSYHSGSHDNLRDMSYSRSTSTPSYQTTDFALRGYTFDSSTSTSATTVASESYTRPTHEKGKPFAPASPQELDRGMTVLVTRACGKIGRGQVKFIGHLPTKSDTIYIGLELKKNEGKHDGHFNGKRFFKCKPNHGIFVPFNKVVMAYT